jgi:hypothetical protein
LELVLDTAPVVALAFSPDDRLLVAGNDRGEVIWWEAATGSATQREEQPHVHSQSELDHP